MGTTSVTGAQGNEEAESDSALGEKIVFTLTLFPRLTPTMLQVGIGPHVPPRRWRPILERLVTEGKISREERGVTTPIGQYRTVTILSLSEPVPLEELMESYRQVDSGAAAPNVAAA